MKNLRKKYEEKFNTKNSKVKMDQSWVRYFNDKNSSTYKRYEYCISKLYGNVIDVGSGDGFGAYLMLKNEKIKNIDCVEIQDTAIKQAELNLKKFNNVKINKGIAENLEFEENYFDSAFCGQTLEHVFDDTKVISEICRVIKDLAVFTVPIKEGVSLLHIREYEDENEIKIKLKEYFNVIEERIFLDEKANIKRIAFVCKK